MKKVILIKYGELTTKKNNRGFFIKTLIRNIESKLSNIVHYLDYDFYRMFVEVGEENFEKTMEILSKIFGIYEIVIAYEIDDNSIESIGENAVTMLKNVTFNTFKVITKRSDKTYPLRSMEVSPMIGGYILRGIPNISVDVHTPDVNVNVEIRQNNKTYLYLDEKKASCGYPVGSLGSGLLMLSGGIDSPVAGYFAYKRGVKLDYVYFESIPHTSLEARNKVIKLANILSEYGTKSKLFIIPFTKIQETIYERGREDYLITVMRRMMYRISVKLAKKNNHLAVFNGESIGQVASQTLTSMGVVNEVTSFPIIRPLASYDKLEIIDISKKIGTYDTSILPYEDCCTIFVPKHPAINPKLDIVEDIEKTFDYEQMIEEAIENLEVIKIPYEEEKSEYL